MEIIRLVRRDAAIEATRIERERCAKIAEEIEIETAPYDPTKSKMCASFAHHQRFHAARIAAAIRGITS